MTNATSWTTSATIALVTTARRSSDAGKYATNSPAETPIATALASA